jgi:hypothetical protein
MLRAVGDRFGLLDPGIEHFPLHQMGGKQAGGAKAEHRDAHQDAELGCNTKIAELHRTSPDQFRMTKIGQDNRY